MKITLTSFQTIKSWRDKYREEMACQIVHDSMHLRNGWAETYLLETDESPVGYGSILCGGPWQGTRTVFEFYLLPTQRSRIFEYFEAFLKTSDATAMTVQTNDTILTPLLHRYCENIESEKIVFKDLGSTSLPFPDVILRRAEGSDSSHIFEHHLEPIGDWVLGKGDEIIATGGFLTHYNPPYADIFMEVAEPHRRKGYGSFLVQELKVKCYESGKVPCCRCSLDNEASIKTIQRAGFVPCAHILTGRIKVSESAALNE